MNFEQALEKFVQGCQKIYDDYMDNNFPNNPREKLVVRNPRAKYIAIDKGSSVYCFVAAQDGYTKQLGQYKQGDIFKSASYKVPAKHARGNIFADNCLECMGPYGANYLK